MPPLDTPIPLLVTLAILAGLAGCGPRSADTPAAEYPAMPSSAETPEAPQGQAPSVPTRSLPALDPSVEGVAVGTSGAVSSAERHATRAGIAILKAGGNAVDAAVAVGFVLAVTNPSAGNLGGGGFMVVRMADSTTLAIDYRETAPSAATADMYLDAKGNVSRDSLVGPRAAGIPGTVAGMALAHKRFGTRPWAELLAAAIGLARDGHNIDAHHAKKLARGAERMKAAGQEASARHYLGEDGKPLAEGALWKQPELAATLELIATKGPRAFYEGSFAEKLAKGVQSLGGIWKAKDLAGYRAIGREPIAFDYLGHRIISMPPPSAGGVVMRQILGASELLGIHKKPWHSPEAVHLYVEAARRAYADRNYLLADPDFADVPIAKLTSREYIARRMADVNPHKATPSEDIKGGSALPAESRETTHYSVADVWGNAVANTYTLNTGFGAKVVVPGTGVLLNNEMDDFSAKPGTPNAYGLVQGKRNRIEPGKRMLSSMTPTIIAKDGQLRAILGTPGGSTITTTVVQLVRALVDHSMPLDAAVRAPRIHHQWKPDRIIVESSIEPSLQRGLESLGHQVIKSRWGSIGHAHCIEVDPATNGFRAVADVTRGDGEAAAY